MAQHGENIYRRRDGRWEARVIRDYAANGKPLFAYFYGHTYEEAKEKLYMLPAVRPKADTRADGFKSSLVFENVLDAWLDSIRLNKKLKESTYVKYLSIVGKHIKPLLGKYPITELNSAIFAAYAALKLNPKDYSTTSGGVAFGGAARGCLSNLSYDVTGGLSEKTVGDILRIIKSVLQFAAEELSLPEVNVNIRLPHKTACVKTKSIRSLTEDERARLEKYLCSDMDISKLGVLLCLNTGLRVGEICALKWGDISMEEKILTVSRTMQRVQTAERSGQVTQGQQIPKANSQFTQRPQTPGINSRFIQEAQMLETNRRPKTKVIITDLKSDGSARIIHLPDTLTEKLEMFRTTCRNAYFLTGEENSFIEPRTYQNRFKAYAASCGIKDASFSSLRDTFAARCL